MSKELDSKSRNILNFRPSIGFVEPDQEPSTPNPIPKPAEFVDDGLEAEKIRQELYNLAASVDVLATALQSRIDLKAKEMRIKLDPKVDADAIAALKREFPDIPFTTKDTDLGPEEDGFYITYDMYKHCRDNIRKYADDQAGKNRISKDQIDTARGLLDKTIIGGFGSPGAKDGTLRPELSNKAQLIEPLDISKFQNYLIRILINFLWKMFLRKPLAAFPPLDWILPEELAPIPSGFKKQLSDAKKKGVEVLG